MLFKLRECAMVLEDPNLQTIFSRGVICELGRLKRRLESFQLSSPEVDDAS
jgi:hypothetical protein